MRAEYPSTVTTLSSIGKIQEVDMKMVKATFWIRKEETYTAKMVES